MKNQRNIWLIMGAVLNAIAALLHIAIIFGGASWYRFFGAGEEMALAAQEGHLYPTIITLLIAIVLTLWGLYALSGAGIVRKLPLLKWGLIVITSIYLLRGLAAIPLLIFSSAQDFATEQDKSFLIWSSVICTIYGLIHLIGTIQSWNSIKELRTDVQ